MGNKIIVCGGNGAGKSTLGEYLAKQLGCKFMDIEDYYFPEKRSQYPYENARTREEALDLLRTDMKKYDDYVLASVKGDYGYEAESLFTCAVLVNASLELRMRRVRERSFKIFGERILLGGDLYEKEKQFFDMVERHSIQDVEEWLKIVCIPTIRVDGTETKEYNAEKVIRQLKRCVNLR